MAKSISRKKKQQLKKHEAAEAAYKEKYKHADLWTWIGLGTLFFLFFVWGSQYLPVTDPVESNYALTAKEMVSSGNWISPTIYGSYWYDKPIMTYWLLALSYLCLGINDFASRLPSALAGALSAVAVMWYTKRITKDRKIALWAGIITGTSIEVWALSHAIITDNFLFLFTIPTMLSAYIGLTEHNKKHMMIAYGAAAFACLTKGPVGLVLPGLLLLIWCAFMRNKSYFARLFPWQGILIFLVLAFPWYGAMYALHGSDFINQFLGLHNVMRATTSEHPEFNHWYYYFIILPLSLLPWTGLTGYSIVKGWKERKPFYLFLLIWLAGVFVFYSLMATKYPTYTYIAVIPGLLLASLAYHDVTEGNKAASLCTVIPFFLLLITGIIATFFVPSRQWIVLYVIALYPVWTLLLHWKGSIGRRLAVVAATTASLYLCLVTFGFPGFLMTRTTEESAYAFSEMPGAHYFFRSYPASYTFYSGQVGTKIDPSQPLEEKRSAVWNEKYMMPVVTESEFVNQAKSTQDPVYVYVEKVDSKYFDEWDLKDSFDLVSQYEGGRIYQMKHSYSGSAAESGKPANIQ